MDVYTKAKRSNIMSKVRSKNTSSELKLRKFLFQKGFRYRIHYKKLPGSPDIVFPGKRKVIFIHGCFWHQHEKCNRGKAPKTNLEYWMPKLEKNKERDAENLKMLQEMGWLFIVLWECEFRSMKKFELVKKKTLEFLQS